MDVLKELLEATDDEVRLAAAHVLTKLAPRSLARYSSLLQRRPIPTNIATGGVLAVGPRAPNVVPARSTRGLALLLVGAF